MEFQGKIYPVNPGYSEIMGLKCYPAPSDISDNIDIAIFAVPASIVLEILKGSVENIKGAIIVSSGFRETGPEGEKMEARLKKNNREKGDSGYWTELPWNLRYSFKSGYFFYKQ
jgi:acyl-CoA synthetase (NDP forming)